MEGTRKSIWHDAEEEPQLGGYILVKQHIPTDIYCVTAYDRVNAACVKNGLGWKQYVCDCDVVKWCYEVDLENV